MLKLVAIFLFATLMSFESAAQDSLATVYFYKPGRAGQPFAGYVVFNGDQAIGRVKQGRLFAYLCRPGVQTFKASNESGAGSITLAVEPGVWYFVRSDLAEGKPTFEKVVGNEAEKEIFKIDQRIAAEMPSHWYSKSFQPVAQIGDSVANIYFYRTGSVPGFAVSYTVTHENNPIGRITIKSAFGYRCKPGLQTFTAKTEGETSISLEVKAGRSYFIRCGVMTGVTVGRPAFRLVPTEDGINDILKIDVALASTIPVGISGYSEQPDTLRALTNLFQRKRKGGITRAVVFGVVATLTTISLVTSKPTTIKQGGQTFTIEDSKGPGYFFLGLSAAMITTGVIQSSNHSNEKLQKALTDYKDGKPVPEAIKRKFKAKDFK